MQELLVVLALGLGQGVGAGLAERRSPPAALLPVVSLLPGSDRCDPV